MRANATETAKHTAGPWKLKPIESATHAGEPITVYDIDRDVPFNPCRMLSDYVGQFNGTPQDARLIAAAPELLEALKALVAYGEARQSVLLRFDQSDSIPEIQAARAAIAKAETP